MILALRRELHAFVAAGLGILEDFTFVIANHDLFVVVIKNVTGIDRDFAAAAGGLCSSTCTRLGATLTRSGERDAPGRP